MSDSIILGHSDGKVSLQYQDYAAILYCAIVYVEMVLGLPATTSTKYGIAIFAVSAILQQNLEIRLNAHYVWLGAIVTLYLAHIVVDGIGTTAIISLQLMNGVQYLLLAPLLYRTKATKSRLILSVCGAIFSIGLLLALVGFGKLFLATAGTHLEVFYANGIYPRGTALHTDYNVFGTGMVMAAGSGTILWQMSNHRHTRVFLYLCIILIVIAAITTGSRRSSVMAIILLSLFFSLKKEPGRAGLEISYLRLVIVIVVGVVLITAIRDILSYLLSLEQSSLSLADSLGRYEYYLSRPDWYLSRTDRFFSSANILMQYDLIELLVGGGNEYLSMLADRHGVSIGYDYPHNVLLSAMLFGGITGLTVTIILIISVMKRQTDALLKTGWLFRIGISMPLVILALSSSDTLLHNEMLLLLSVLTYQYTS